MRGYVCSLFAVELANFLHFCSSGLVFVPVGLLLLLFPMVELDAELVLEYKMSIGILLDNVSW